MLLGRLGRIVAVLGLMAVPLAAAPAAWADHAPPSQVKSRYETSPGGHSVTRDAGYSALEPGTANSLWLFADSTWGCEFCFSFTGTAAVGPSVRGLVPTRLTEIPTPAAAINAPSSRPPEKFFPDSPTGLKQPNGKPCPIPASWPTGVAAEPAGGKMLITYVDACDTGLEVERFHVAQYDPRRNTLSGMTQVFADTSAGLPFQEYLGSPIFLGGFLYLFGSQCASPADGACASGKVVVARVPADAAHWQNPHAYRWWDGSAWVLSPARAKTIIKSAKPLALAYSGNFSALFPHHTRFVIITQTSTKINAKTNAAGFTLWQASSLTGTWTGTATTVPCANGGGTDTCRAFIGHPELSTSSRVMMTYFDPGAIRVTNPKGNHIVATEVPY